MKMILICLILGLSACSTIAVNTEIPVPPQPSYPVFSSAEVKVLSTLPKNVRIKLILRDKLKTEHINVLENIIRATH